MKKKPMKERFEDPIKKKVLNAKENKFFLFISFIKLSKQKRVRKKNVFYTLEMKMI